MPKENSGKIIPNLKMSFQSHKLKLLLTYVQLTKLTRTLTVKKKSYILLPLTVKLLSRA